MYLPDKRLEVIAPKSERSMGEENRPECWQLADYSVENASF
jgi:hypothetical protein